LQLLDVFSLEIQMYMDQGDKSGVKKTYEKAVKIVESNPGTLTSKLPIFQYCGGKIMMEDGDFDTAYATLFDAFKYYQDIGSEIRIPCLKYMLIANMLKEVRRVEADGDEKAEVQAKINPFDSKEVANMRNHASIEPIAQLLDAYERNNIRNVERILREHAKEITDDPFLGQFIARLLTKVRIAKILEMVKPYSRINCQFIATQLTIELDEVEDLLVRLILDNEIEGKINQVGHVLQLQAHADSAARYRALERWSTQIGGVSKVNKKNQNKKRKKINCFCKRPLHRASSLHEKLNNF
jgi:COP9 signalosome complex subunit 2